MARHPHQAVRTKLSAEQYCAQITELLASTASELGVEQVPIEQALGRVTAAAICAQTAIPPDTNSAMDGYALRWSDVAQVSADNPSTLTVVAHLPAGSAEDPPLRPGECARIMTGAPVPTQADTVIPVELTNGGADTASVHDLPTQGQGAHIRPAGDDIPAGAPLLQPGVTLGAAELTAISAAGVAQVSVRERPRVAVLTTGSELIAPGQKLNRGGVYESNSHYLHGRLLALGAEPVMHRALADDLDSCLQAIDDAAATTSLVLMTGGVSVGDFDVVRQALETHGQAHLLHIAMQPGKPQAYALWRGHTPLLAFPGNPISAAISFELFGRTAIDTLLGRAPVAPLTVRAALGWRSPVGRAQYLPARLSTTEEGVAQVTPNHGKGSASHTVTSMAGADVLAVVPAECTQVEPGQLLTCHRLSC